MKRQPNKPRRNALLTKAQWQAIRRRYTWHLRSPFKKKFSHSHWWDDQADIEPAAALYELARRHPLVREQWLRNFKSDARLRLHSPPGIRERWTEKIVRPLTGTAHVHYSLHWTCLLGLKSWDELSYTDRKNWKRNCGDLKGLDSGADESQCLSITRNAHWDIIAKRKAALRKIGELIEPPHELADAQWEEAQGKNVRRLHKFTAENPPTNEELETAIQHEAVEAFREGYLLLAVAPDLNADKAASVMAKVYKSTRSRYFSPKQRARWQDWLPLIKTFENSVTTQDSAYAQEFARYRRVVDSLRFE